MSKVLIIGCGGVASVAIHKCCQVPEVFTEICIASRTKSKCDKLAAAADDEDFTHGKFLLCWLFYVNASKCVKPGTRASLCPARSGAPAAPCRPLPWTRRRHPAWGPAR